MKKINKELLFGIVLLATLCNSLMAFDNVISEDFTNLARNKFYDRLMTTISPNVELSGPIFINRSDKKTEYAHQLMKIILREADKRAQRYLKAGEFQAYYSFLVLALTVPLQEGLYMQFREVYDDPTLCNEHSASGDILFSYSAEKLAKQYSPEELEEKKKSSTVYKNFLKALKNPSAPFFPSCKNFKVTDGPVHQIIRGPDGSDMGMMQLSIRWHFDEFYANKNYQSVEKTVRYGLKHLMKGFRSILANQNKYSCLGIKRFFQKRVTNYTNLIRGTWAGKYNSGSIKKTCRFSDFSSKYKAHDEGFMKNLKKVLAYDENREIGAGGILGFTTDEVTHEVLAEVIMNFKNKTNVRTAIEKFISE